MVAEPDVQQVVELADEVLVEAAAAREAAIENLDMVRAWDVSRKIDDLLDARLALRRADR